MPIQSTPSFFCPLITPELIWNNLVMFVGLYFLLITLQSKSLEDALIFQQMGYYTKQYLKKVPVIHFFGDHLFFYTSIATGIVGAAGFLRFGGHLGWRIASLALAFIAYLLQSLIAKGIKPKKPLAFTPRMRRLFFTETLIVVLPLLVALPLLRAQWFSLERLYFFYLIYVGVLFLFSQFLLVAANTVNRPVELMINEHYYRDAKKVLSEAPFLKVAAITGSFGKTSIKNIVGSMLSSEYNTLISPASFNTKLGLTKTIRGELVPTTEIFVAEMGAKKLGEIQEIVEMVTPDVSLISTIVGQHLETFGSIENIAVEKSKVYHFLKQGGTAIVNIDDERVSTLPLRSDVKKITVSVKQEADIYITDAVVCAEGSQFTLVDARREIENSSANAQSKEKANSGAIRIPMHTPLLGSHNLLNIALSAAMALELGASRKAVKRAVERLQPVKNRLSTRIEKGFTVLEDAFNSNPIGAKAALDVLQLMPANKRIVITPGMIELGEDEPKIHNQFGRQIAAVADHVILVTKKQTEHIYQGLQDAGFDRNHVEVMNGMRAALARMVELAGPGDVVLIENDLPDAFEETA